VPAAAQASRRIATHPTQANHNDFHFKTLFFTEGRNTHTAESATFALLCYPLKIL